MKDGERKAVERLIGFLRANLFEVHSASDGEARLYRMRPGFTTPTNDTMLIDWSGQCDEGRLYFEDRLAPGEKRQTVVLVYGNAEDGSEVAADHSCVGRFEALMDQWYAAEELHYADGRGRRGVRRHDCPG